MREVKKSLSRRFLLEFPCLVCSFLAIKTLSKMQRQQYLWRRPPPPLPSSVTSSGASDPVPDHGWPRDGCRHNRFVASIRLKFDGGVYIVTERNANHITQHTPKNSQKQVCDTECTAP